MSVMDNGDDKFPKVEDIMLLNRPENVPKNGSNKKDANVVLVLVLALALVLAVSAFVYYRKQLVNNDLSTCMGMDYDEALKKYGDSDESVFLEEHDDKVVAVSIFENSEYSIYGLECGDSEVSLPDGFSLINEGEEVDDERRAYYYSKQEKYLLVVDFDINTDKIIKIFLGFDVDGEGEHYYSDNYDDVYQNYGGSSDYAEADGYDDTDGDYGGSNYTGVDGNDDTDGDYGGSNYTGVDGNDDADGDYGGSNYTGIDGNDNTARAYGGSSDYAEADGYDDTYEDYGSDGDDSSYNDDNGYIIPYSDSVKLTKADLKELSKEELRIARNEIYARHGRKFLDAGLQEYFDSQDWYYGTIEPEDFVDSEELSALERRNAKFIKKYE